MTEVTPGSPPNRFATCSIVRWIRPFTAEKKFEVDFVGLRDVFAADSPYYQRFVGHRQERRPEVGLVAVSTGHFDPVLDF